MFSPACLSNPIGKLRQLNPVHHVLCAVKSTAKARIHSGHQQPTAPQNDDDALSIKGELRNSMGILAGVSQGCILGPILSTFI